MNQINTIYTTVSKGQTHIAADTRYIGSVNSYNNCFTQFFTSLFGRSVSVNFDGKIRSVNKESYTNLIRNLTTQDKIDDIRQHGIFRSVAEKSTLPTNNVKMRDVIASKDRKELFRKLAIAISKGDTTKSLLMIGKGAELDAVYFDRNTLSPSFDQDTSDLSQSKYIFTVFHAAPILQAVRKGNHVVAKFLQEAGANTEILGRQYTFKREITDVRRFLEFAVQPTLVPHHYHVRDAQGREHDQTRHQMEYKTKLDERTIVTTQDSRSDEKSYTLSGVGYQLTEI